MKPHRGPARALPVTDSSARQAPAHGRAGHCQRGTEGHGTPGPMGRTGPFGEPSLGRRQNQCSSELPRPSRAARLGAEQPHHRPSAAHRMTILHRDKNIFMELPVRAKSVNVNFHPGEAQPSCCGPSHSRGHRASLGIMQPCLALGSKRGGQGHGMSSCYGVNRGKPKGRVLVFF